MSCNKEARSKPLPPRLDRSKAERRAAERPGDQPGTEGKQGGDQRIAERDNEKEELL